MAIFQDLYKTLSEMIQYAELDFSQKVYDLNQNFETLFHQVSGNSPPDLAASYDNCRQSCVMATTVRAMRKDFLEDAKERFSTLPRN